MVVDYISEVLSGEHVAHHPREHHHPDCVGATRSLIRESLCPRIRSVCATRTQELAAVLGPASPPIQMTGVSLAMLRAVFR